MTITILHGDCREVLRGLPAQSVHCVVTSPPYWGLRDYGVAGQIGLENHYPDYVDRMVEVFDGVRRVLRADGTVWLNLGDSYNGYMANQRATSISANNQHARPFFESGRGRRDGSLKAKDLVGIPWRVAFALQADGWYLRQDIIWSKPNPMPESVTDRCTKAHEYLFLLSKSERYYFDQEAIKEEACYSGLANQDESGFKDPRSFDGKHKNGYRSSGNKSHKAVTEYERSDSEEHRTKAGLLKISETAYAVRNKRSVWEIPTAPYADAHFATFPPALIEPCILAGCPKGGTVLDPFAGAGTTGLVADRLGRSATLIELNPEYAAMAERRIKGDAGMFADVSLKARESR